MPLSFDTVSIEIKFDLQLNNQECIIFSSPKLGGTTEGSDGPGFAYFFKVTIHSYIVFAWYPKVYNLYHNSIKLQS